VKRWYWIFLAVVVLAGLLLRAHDVSRIFLWLDETDMFNEYLYGAHPKSLVDFALTTRNATTVTWGWPAVIWIVSRVFGPTIGAARMATVLASTLGILLMFLLVQRLLERGFRGSPFLPAIFAAILMTMAMPQMEYAQRTYPYGVLPCIAATILLTHFGVLRAAGKSWRLGPELLRAGILYTAAVSIALCLHASVALLPAVSMAFLLMKAIPVLRLQSWAERKPLLRATLGMGFVIFVAALLNAKNPKFGFRPYLVDYYSPLAISSVPKLLQHAYDLATYHLNLFYNPSLYWPRSLNLAILPLVLICVTGWAAAVFGRFGAEARHLAGMAAAAVAAPAALSLISVFPFGGVRQSLFLSPFFFVFAALGFYNLGAHRATRYVTAAVAAAYLVVWAGNLPRFYAERLPVYTPNDLLSAWNENGRQLVYARECEREVRYELRDHPEVRVEALPRNSKAPYLLIATHNWIGDNSWFSGFPDYLRRSGYKATLVRQTPARHMDSPAQSLYFPPNGLWIYEVTAQ
jgi:hypothetical protein